MDDVVQQEHVQSDYSNEKKSQKKSDGEGKK